MLDRKENVELEVNVQARFFDEDAMAYNTIAEIPGSEKNAQLVMLGAHMDSWHGGTGATDNGAGVAVATLIEDLKDKERGTFAVEALSRIGKPAASAEVHPSVR